MQDFVHQPYFSVARRSCQAIAVFTRAPSLLDFRGLGFRVQGSGFRV